MEYYLIGIELNLALTAKVNSSNIFLYRICDTFDGDFNLVVC